MNVNHLRFFIAAVEEGSVTAAAQRCFVTQPTLSAGLQSLEDEVGGRLLERSRKGASLTPLGLKLLVTAREIVHRVNTMRSAANRFEQNAELGLVDRHLRFAVSTTFAPAALKLLIGCWRQLGFNSLRMLEIDPGQGSEYLSSGRADVVLESGLNIASNKRMSNRLKIIGSDPLGMAVPSQHHLARRKRLTIPMLDGENIIVRIHAEETPMATRLLRRYHSSPVVVARVASDKRALDLVDSGLGVCLMPRSLADQARLHWCSVQYEKMHKTSYIQWLDSWWDKIFENAPSLENH